ncbi:MAG: hypothetical protein LAO78_09555 [Acidobacteriia bacterium]|nr:hypothetical protein [Terriglobia bacterium]
MRLSADEAKELLNKWASEKIPVRAVFVARSGHVASALSGTLWGVPPQRVAVKSFSNPDEDFMYFQFTGCAFEYGDTREAPATLQEYATGKYVSVVTVLLPDSLERVYLFELNND